MMISTVEQWRNNKYFIFSPTVKCYEIQGAALYAYYNAQFMDDDWESICLVNQSLKENEPLKVGRFGLGFKSIYHMTGYVQQTVSFKRLLNDSIC